MSIEARVLVVDDEQGTNVLIQRVLKPLQIEVVGVKTADDAINAIEEGNFSVIVLNIMLGASSGIEVLSKVRSMEDRMKTPVVVMTAMVDGGWKDECERLGVVNFVEKPIDIKSFRDVVSDLIGE